MSNQTIGVLAILALALFILFGMVTLVRSNRHTEVVEPTTQVYTPVLAFEHDGCKVYRFMDHFTGHTEYYADCRGEHTEGN